MSQFNDLDEPDFDDADLDAVLAGADDAFEIDLSGAVEFSKLTDETGWFPAELTKVERHTSKTGNPCLKWFSKVAPGHAQAGAFLPIQTLNLSGRAAGRTKAMLRAIGWPEGAKFSPTGAIGRTFEAYRSKDASGYWTISEVRPLSNEAPDVETLGDDELA